MIVYVGIEDGIVIEVLIGVCVDVGIVDGCVDLFVVVFCYCIGLVVIWFVVGY